MQALISRFVTVGMLCALPLVSPACLVSACFSSEVGDGTLLVWDHWEQRHLPHDPRHPETVKPVVLVVPGMMNGDDSMSIFKQRFSEEEIPAAMFRYDSVLGVEAVAKKLNALLRLEAEKYPNRKLILLTHSMGGVVCRRVVEDPAFELDCVSRLIMVAPPNAGSTLATLEGEKIKELSKKVQDKRIAEALGNVGPALIKETLELYTGQARIDLAPDSPLLQKVNSFQRNPRINYTVIAGTKAPIPIFVFGLGGSILESFNLGNGALVANVKDAAQAFKRDEWINTRGDGAVTIVSTRLPGVPDQVELPFAHCDTCRDPESEGNKILVQNVMRRLYAR